jgi:hypothetical protein
MGADGRRPVAPGGTPRGSPRPDGGATRVWGRRRGSTHCHLRHGADRAVSSRGDEHPRTLTHRLPRERPRTVAVPNLPDIDLHRSCRPTYGRLMGAGARHRIEDESDLRAGHHLGPLRSEVGGGFPAAWRRPAELRGSGKNIARKGLSCADPGLRKPPRAPAYCKEKAQASSSCRQIRPADRLPVPWYRARCGVSAGAHRLCRSRWPQRIGPAILT